MFTARYELDCHVFSESRIYVSSAMLKVSNTSNN